jgi:hypothetical protein
VLTTAEVAAHLERLSYRPGWSFAVYDGRWEGQHHDPHAPQADRDL